MILGYIRSYWWLFVMLIISIPALLYIVKKKGKTQSDGNEIKEIQTFASSVLLRSNKAATDVQIEKAIIKTKSEQERDDLRRIKNIKDENQRRKELSDKFKMF